MSVKDVDTKQTENPTRQHREPQRASLESTVLEEHLEPGMLQRAIADPTQAHPADLLALQRRAGNRAVNHLIQTKLIVGAAGDQYEQEADQVAERVMSMPALAGRREGDFHLRGNDGGQEGAQRQMDEEEIQTKPLVQRQEDEEEEIQTKPLVQRQEDEEEIQTKPLVQRQEDEEEIQTKPLVQRQEDEEEIQTKPLVQRQEDEEEIQTKPLVQRQEEEEEIQTKPWVQRHTDGSFEAGSQLEGTLGTQKGKGSPLSDDVRASMEPRFGADFSGVRVHTGGEAAQLSQDLGARAFTHGQDIYFKEGEYSPETHSGQTLLAHELTHTLQQGASKRIQGWWPTGHRLVSELAIEKGQFDRYYDPKVLAYLVDRSPDVDFIQDESDTMNRGIAESEGKIKLYKKLRKKKETQQQAIDMYNENEIHYRRPAYMLSHGEAGLYKDEDASAKNEAVTKRLVAKAINLWKSYDHGQSMSILSDALHQAEDRGSHGEGNAFTGHDARISVGKKYYWEKQGIQTFKAKVGGIEPSKWAPDNASVNKKGLVLGVGFGQGVLEAFRRGVGATEENKVEFPEHVLKEPPKKRKMKAKSFLPKTTSGASMVGAVGKTATGSWKGEKKKNMDLVFEQTLGKGGMSELYETAKRIPKEEIPPEFQDLLEEGLAFFEQGAGLLQNDPLYSKTYNLAKAKFEKWGRSRLRKGGLKKKERRQRAKEYYLEKKLAQKGRKKAVVGEAIRAAYKKVFNAALPITDTEEEEANEQKKKEGMNQVLAQLMMFFEKKKEEEKKSIDREFYENWKW